MHAANIELHDARNRCDVTADDAQLQIQGTRTVPSSSTEHIQESVHVFDEDQREQTVIMLAKLVKVARHKAVLEQSMEQFKIVNDRASGKAVMSETEQVNKLAEQYNADQLQAMSFALAKAAKDASKASNSASPPSPRLLKHGQPKVLGAHVHESSQDAGMQTVQGAQVFENKAKKASTRVDASLAKDSVPPSVGVPLGVPAGVGKQSLCVSPPVCGSAKVSPDSPKTEGAPAPSAFAWRDFSQPNNKVLGFGLHKNETYKTSPPKKLGKVDGTDDIGVARLRSASSQSASS